MKYLHHEFKFSTSNQRLPYTQIDPVKGDSIYIADSISVIEMKETSIESIKDYPK